MSFYLRHAVGFFIQLFPCGLLCFLPFSGEKLRFRRKWIFTALTISILLLSMLFPLVLTVTSSMPFGDIIHNLYMLSAVILMVVAYLWLLREVLVKKLLVIYLTMFYEAGQYWLVVMILPLLNHGHYTGEVYPAQVLFLWGVTTVVMLPMAILAFRSVVRDFISEIEPESMKQEFFMVMFSTLIYFVLMIYYNSVADYTSLAYWRLYGPPFLLVSVEQCLVYWLLLRESVRRKRDSEKQKALEIQQLQYENITREMENARRMRHDMRHYLNGLIELLEQNRKEEMKDYLLEVIEHTSGRANEVYCQNSTINGLLQYYVGQAQEEGIRCDVQAECGELTISSTDLTVLFGNAMENSIHACQKIKENRWISIQVGTIGDSLVVQISNPCQKIYPSGHYQLDGEYLPAAAFLSSRVGGGYGLGSMEHTAQKYGGDARFRFDEDTKTFTTRIRLNLHPEAL